MVGRDRRLMIAVMALGLVACGEEEETPPMGGVRGEMLMEEVEGMDHAQEMSMDRGMMARHAEEADSMAAIMRAHLEEMRQLPAAEWHDRMAAHVGYAAGMLRLMDRQMREMDAGMSDVHTGEMMGMSGEEHLRMMEEMQGLRAELEQLQTAPDEGVREVMPAHLGRLEEMTEMLEESGEHMRPR